MPDNGVYAVVDSEIAIIRTGTTRISGEWVAAGQHPHHHQYRNSDEEEQSEFGLIDGSTIRRKHGLDDRLLWCEVSLSKGI